MAHNTDLDFPLPCPFCGAKGKAQFIELTCDKDGKYYVYCMFCGARGPLSKIEFATKNWNRRESK